MIGWIEQEAKNIRYPLIFGTIQLAATKNKKVPLISQNYDQGIIGYVGDL